MIGEQIPSMQVNELIDESTKQWDRGKFFSLFYLCGDTCHSFEQYLLSGSVGMEGELVTKFLCKICIPGCTSLATVEEQVTFFC